ncbi:MAG: Soluble cytochrome b558 [Parcubacteria group bacterium]|nr:Soluble cytochrome b558 [Parcubacteria group bacterium]
MFLVVSFIIILGLTYYSVSSSGSSFRTSSETASSTAVVLNTYTINTVATHSTPTSCWTTISGSVYDVTSWISKHPGGADAIISLCGKDGTAAFTQVHGGQPRPANELAGFKIGTLSK